MNMTKELHCEHCQNVFEAVADAINSHPRFVAVALPSLDGKHVWNKVEYVSDSTFCERGESWLDVDDEVEIMAQAFEECAQLIRGTNE